MKEISLLIEKKKSIGGATLKINDVRIEKRIIVRVYIGFINCPLNLMRFKEN